jgi:hypothetical protein
MFDKPINSTEFGTVTIVYHIDGETGLMVPPSDPEA